MNMSSNSSVKLAGPARVGKSTFLGIAWGSVAVSMLFFVFRVLVRLKVFRRLHADDALVLFACIMLFINTVLWQSDVDDLYENIAVSAGQLFPPPTELPHNTERYLRRSIVVIVLFYTGLWSVKLSFLIFFKRLGHNVRHQSILWWFVLIVTVASWVTCLGTIEYHCLASSFTYITAHCAMGPGPVRFQRLTLRANMILDVLTDALIIVVPVNLLWKVRLSLRKKLALGGIFSITVFIMIFAIVRVVVVSSYSHQPDQTWLYMWSSIEQAVSIMVACVASFPSLFMKSERDKHRRVPERKRANQSDGTSRRGFLWSKISKASKASTHDVATKRTNLVHQIAAIPHGQNLSTPWADHSQPSSDSSEDILPAEQAHIAV